MTKQALSKSIFLYLSVLAVLLITAQPFDGLLMYGVYMGAMYCANPLVVSIMYLAVSLLGGLNGLINAGVRVGVMLLVITMHKVFKKRIGKRLLMLYVLLCNVFYIVYSGSSEYIIFDKIVNVVVGGAFSLVCVYVLRVLFTRGLRYRPLIDEWICVALFVTVLAYSMYGLKWGIYNLGGFVAPFVIMLTMTTLGYVFAFSSAVAFGLGALFATGEFTVLGVLVLMTAVGCLFCKVNRYVGALTLIATDTILAYFASTYGTFDVMNLIPCAVSVAFYMAIPPRIIKYVADITADKTSNNGKVVVNKLRYNLARKLYNLADVFFSMKTTFSAMTVNATPPDKVPPIMVKQLCDNVCVNCTKRADCWRNNLQATEKAMLELTECAVKRGKASILDIDSSLTARCDRLNAVLSYINQSAFSYNEFYRKSTEEDNSRLLIADQLGGVSRIMQRLASDCKGRVTFDSAKEKETIEQLTFHNILTTDAVFVEHSGVLSVIVTVASRDFDGEAIAKIVGKIIKKNLFVEKVEPCESDSWLAVYLAVRPSLQLSYGIRTVTKYSSQMSGDTHSFVNIDGGKFLLAVCDGMGSGENAERVSETAIGLVENFYKAGFDNDVVLSGVNRLLTSYNNNESFTAVDICVVDLNNGLCDFIKLGAVNGLVKTKDEVKLISGSSLPLGVLEEMKPSITKQALSSGDFIVIMSDGVHDCFGDYNAIADILADSVMTNPQILADDIMEKAMSVCNAKPKDDMTIIVARLI